MTRPYINTVSMWVVASTIMLTPFALGGNRPLVWPIVLAVLGVMLAVKSLLLWKFDLAPAASVASFRPEIVLISVFLIFNAVQILPLGDLSDVSRFGLPSGYTLSVAPTETLLALITWLNVFVLAYLVLQFTRNEQRSIRFLTIIFWIVVIHAALGFVLFHEFDDSTLFGPKWTYLGSMTGAFVNRNTFATFLASGAVVGTALILRDISGGEGSLNSSGNLRSLVFKVLGLLLIVAVLFGTGSRMGFFVGIVGVLLMAFLILPKQINTGKTLLKSALIVALCLIVMAAILWGYGNLTVERLGSVDRDADVRLALYRQTWTMTMDRPWTGFGGGTFELAFPLFHQPEVSVDLIWQKAHNSYLGTWADYGLLFGSIPWVVFLRLMAKLALHFWRRPSPDYASAVGIVVGVVAMTHALVDFSLEIHGYALLFMAIIATAAARLAGGERKTL
ncbi:O-antigen ligase family protein [Rhizobium sp. AQ_MP]|uniref:O-antigen ligase family protein n=1 Tax=Rhizobium sp. AQ_MP TaxID=2761536 RepID=UPI0016396D50|nr:O-antigen ligase family protein [Rhizobium sp. AQ_MP]MBC2775875.1 O-antigen ligase family protein [Rhizobium sp. AQ_MP]